MLNKDKKMIELLNAHYNLEQAAANLYNEYSTVMNRLGFKYTAKFLKKLSDDKIFAHLPRLYNYFININADITINERSLPMKFEHNDNVLENMKEMLNNELKIREHINTMADYAFSIKDHETYYELGWFIKDGIKDVNDFQDIIDIMESVDNVEKNFLLVESFVRRWLKDNNDN